MTYTRNQRRRERIVAAIIVFGSLLAAIGIPGWVDAFMVDTPAGIYGENH